MKNNAIKITLSVMLFLSSLSIVRGQNFAWAKSFAATRIVKMCVDNNKNVISTGWYGGASTDFDPSASVYTLSAVASSQDIFVQKLDSAGNFLWAKGFGGPTNVDIGQGITVDVSGNIYVTGRFDGTVDFDPSASVYTLTSNGGTGDCFVVKLDALGNFVWAKTFGGSDSDMGICVTLDGSNNVIVGGCFQSTVDFDPGIGTYTITSVGTTSASPGNQEGFILKLDNSGNFIWAGGINSTGGFSPVKSVKTDASGNVFACGNFNGTKDFDMGAGTYTLAATSSGSGYIMKVTSAGVFAWAKATQMGPGGVANALDLDPLGNVYTVGNYGLSFSMGVGTTTLNTQGSNDIFILKLANNGNFIWAKSVGTTGGYDDANAVVVDPSGSVYLTGYFGMSNGDFDPNVGVYTLSTTVVSAYVLKLNSIGDFVWATSLGASNQTWAWGIARDNSSNIYSAGGFQGVCDFDPSAAVFNMTNVAGENAFIQKLSQGVCSNMTLGFTNVTPLTCTTIGYASAIPANGNAPYVYTWQSTASSTLANASFTAGGIYTVSVNDALGCNRTTGVLIGSPALLTGFDVTGNLVISNYIPSFGTMIKIDALNSGCVSTNGKVKLVLDNVHTFYTNSVPPANTISGDTLIWNYSNLTSSSPHFTANVSVVTKTTSLVGDTVCMDLIVTPSVGDANPANNFKTYCKKVMASYDPNDKQVNPVGACGLGYILNNQVLTYTIRFQNTGTFMASNIVVKDSLSTNLNVNTVRILGSSHPMYTEVAANNILKFHFDNINLPDSNANSQQSHGYVIYEITPIASLPNNSVIKNSAGIYFDFNPAVLTNTVSNTVVNAINCNATGIVEKNNSIASVNVHPNPTSNDLNIYSSSIILKLEVINNIGQLVTVKNNVQSNKTNIDLTSLAQGIYFVQIHTASGVVSKKVVKE
jgi:uncharacterized repeat protein (TIGR01451 family)